MPTRTIEIGGQTWHVYPSGRVTQNDHDEFGLTFVCGSGAGRAVRVTRYTPNGTRSREQSLVELSDTELRDLFDHSQAGASSPETNYSA